MKNLTSEQIEQIEDFCEKWGVNCYDVKVELVDHISTSIETILDQNPNTTFDEAFLQARKNFGGYSFEQIVKKREKSIARNGRKVQLTYLLDFFKLPKILLILTYTFVCCLLIKYLPTTIVKYIGLTILVPALILSMTSSAFYSKADYFMRSDVHYRNQRVVQIKPLLIFSRKNNMNFLGGLLLSCMNILFISGGLKATHPEWIANALLFALAAFAWISFDIFFHQKKLLVDYAINTYPEAFELKQNNYEHA